MQRRQWIPRLLFAKVELQKSHLPRQQLMGG